MKVSFSFLVLLIGACLVHASMLEQEEEKAKQLVQEAIKEATEHYEEMMRQATINGAQSRRHTREAQKSTKSTQEIGKISTIYRNASKKLKNILGSDMTLKLIQEALPQQCQFETLRCDVEDKYRSVDGTCNNIRNPYWGAAKMASLRLLDPAYKDGIEEPRGGQDGSGLPPSRQVSLGVHIGDGNSYEPNVTHMVAQFGQFLDHDITLTPVNSLACCGNPTPPDECWKIDVAADDPFYKNHSVTCLDFVRSTETCFASSLNITHREQFNDITAYIDGSVVYGSDANTTYTLRNHIGGRLTENSEHPGFLPWRSDVIPGGDNASVIAGDVRANEMPGLTVLQSLFLREHNRIADELAKLREDWNDEKIFQETRRIIAAELQQITYGEFLPAMLGQQAMKTFDLELPAEHTSYTNYEPSVDATIYNYFATAAYRFGHTLVNGLIKLYLDNNIVGEYHVRDNYLVSQQIIENTHNRVSGYDLILNGLIRQKSQAYDGEIHQDMTNHLFKTASFIGSDLAARNIQRGRDHGIPSYNEFRKYCNLSSLPESWYPRPEDISETSWLKLQEAGYKSPQDIDLYTGGLSEVPVAGALSGPTFVCLQAIQFQKLMKGDRFFFTHGDVSGSFSPEQLVALRGHTLGDIICQNSVIKEAPRNVFYIESQLNPMESCDMAKRRLNVKLFADLTSDAKDSGTAIYTAFATLFLALLCSFTARSGFIPRIV